MKDNNTLSFKNRSFRQVEIILALFFIFAVVQALFFENRFINAVVGVGMSLILIAMVQPHKYTIEGGKLTLNFYLKRNKIINIGDIKEIDVAKHNCLPFKYKPVGFENLSHERLMVKDVEIREIQEELTKRNSNIEVLFS